MAFKVQSEQRNLANLHQKINSNDNPQNGYYNEGNNISLDTSLGRSLTQSSSREIVQAGVYNARGGRISFVNHSNSINSSDFVQVSSMMSEKNDPPIHATVSKSDHRSPRGFACCNHKYRFFITALLLIGITLATYSRSLLYLSAVRMIAGNVAAKEIATSRTQMSEANIGSGLLSEQQQLSDGSCPVEYNKSRVMIKRNNLTDLAKSSLFESEYNPNDQEMIVISIKANYANDGIKSNVIDEASSVKKQTSLNELDRTQSELEASIRDKVRKRVEAGELVDWGPRQQGFIFAASSVGNLFMAIPLSRFSEIYGPHKVIILASLSVVMHAFLFPFVAKMSVPMVILFELATGGIVHGIETVCYTFFAHWLGPTELAFATSTLVAAFQLGSSIANLATAKILSMGYPWTYTFYAPGLTMSIFSLLWIIFAADKPEDCQYISLEEINYVKDTKRQKQLQKCDGKKEKRHVVAIDCETGKKASSTHNDNSTNNDNNNRNKKAPWKLIFSDATVLALIMSKFATRWYFGVVGSLMPTYLNNIVHTDIDLIATVTGLNNIIGLVFGVFIGYKFKSLVHTRPFNWSLSRWRKIFQSVAHFGIASSMFIMTMFDCDTYVIIATLVANTILIGFAVVGVLQVPLDMSHQYCSLITSISNTFAIGQILGPPVSGWIIQTGPQNRQAWKYVWWIVVAWHVIGGTVFCIFIDASPRNFDETASIVIRTNKEDISRGQNQAVHNEQIRSVQSNIDDCNPPLSKTTKSFVIESR